MTKPRHAFSAITQMLSGHNRPNDQWTKLTNTGEGNCNMYHAPESVSWYPVWGSQPMGASGWCAGRHSNGWWRVVCRTTFQWVLAGGVGWYPVWGSQPMGGSGWCAGRHSNRCEGSSYRLSNIIGNEDKPMLKCIRLFCYKWHKTNMYHE